MDQLSARFLVWSLLVMSFGVAEAQQAGLGAECESPLDAWIWCDDFEEDRSSSYFESDLQFEQGAGLQGSTAATFIFQQGSSSAGGAKLAFGATPSSYFKPVDEGSARYNEVYWRIFVRLPDDWVGNGADKLSRATILSTPNWSQALIAHVWSGSDPGPASHLLVLDPASGTDEVGELRTTGYNDFENLRWLGAESTTYGVFADENLGEWQCVEAYVRVNDPDLSNGTFRLFVNDQLEVSIQGLNWVGNYSDYGLNAIFLENYWNSGSPTTQARYMDNFVVSTARIGCTTNPGTSIPNPPILRTEL